MAIDWEGLLGCSTHLQEAYDDLVMDAVEKESDRESREDFYQSQDAGEGQHFPAPEDVPRSGGVKCPFCSLPSDNWEQQTVWCAHPLSTQESCPNCPFKRNAYSDDSLPF